MIQTLLLVVSERMFVSIVALQVTSFMFVV
jgi:hypothetical protein